MENLVMERMGERTQIQGHLAMGTEGVLEGLWHSL